MCPYFCTIFFCVRMLSLFMIYRICTCKLTQIASKNEVVKTFIDQFTYEIFSMWTTKNGSCSPHKKAPFFSFFIIFNIWNKMVKIYTMMEKLPLLHKQCRFFSVASIFLLVRTETFFYICYTYILIFVI